MTPKEKAEELVNKFRQQTDGIAGYNYDNVNKQCALIAVDVILIDVGAKDWSGDIACDGRNYWQEVKQEINNLENENRG
jgi:peptide subunit release factor 1 (eRF1)